MVALISHDHSWTVPTRRANNCCHAAHAAPFLADTVWQSHSLSSLASAHAERNMHARLRSPCTFPSASSDEQRGGLGLCQTHDASAAIKPVPRRPEKGYAVDVLAARCPAVCQDMTCHLLTTLQLQSSSHASSRHHPSCHDPRRRHLARQGPDCKVTITMSASSIAQRQTCCQATAS